MNFMTSILIYAITALLIITKAKWNSMQFNFTEKAISLLYFFLCVAKIVFGFANNSFLNLVSDLMKFYIEFFIINTFLHRIVSPFAYVWCEICSLISNVFFALIITLFVIFKHVQTIRYFEFLTWFYEFLVFLSACLSLTLALYQVFTPKKKQRQVSSYHREKRTKNIKKLLLYCVIYVIKIATSQQQIQQEILRFCFALFCECGFMIVIILILVIDQLQRRKSQGVPF